MSVRLLVAPAGKALGTGAIPLATSGMCPVEVRETLRSIISTYRFAWGDVLLLSTDLTVIETFLQDEPADRLMVLDGGVPASLDQYYDPTFLAQKDPSDLAWFVLNNMEKP